VVTGATGFIGSHLARALTRDGWQVIGLDRARGVVPGELEANPRFRMVVADLIDAELRPLLDEVSVVFHCAAMTGVRSSWGSRFADYADSNLLATHRLAQACVDGHVPRLVLASSSSVYGPPPGRPSREDDLPCPRSPYGVSKLAAEQLAVAAAHRAGATTAVVALRYFTVYGPRQRPDMLVARVLRAARTGEPVVVFGDGSQRRRYTYVDDVVAATMLAADCEVDRSAVFNVAGPSAVEVREVLDLAADVCGTPIPTRTAERHDGDVDSTDADLTLAADRLGFTPNVPLVDGLARQWAWLHTRPGQAAPVTRVPVMGGSGC
jgi:nucleoside-diphosphate-sugar epimerase